jgi:hypothetical protein
MDPPINVRSEADIANILIFIRETYQGAMQICVRLKSINSNQGSIRMGK